MITLTTRAGHERPIEGPPVVRSRRGAACGTRGRGRRPRSGPCDAIGLKIVEHGADAVVEYELLEYALSLAVGCAEAEYLSRRLIRHYGSFAAVVAAPADEVRLKFGVPDPALGTLKLLEGAARRIVRDEVLMKPVLGNWGRLLDYLTAVLARERVEQFRVLFLDSKNRLIADEAFARGTVNHAPVYPREVVRRALLLHATAIILVHNHPSGDPTPSTSDREMTDQIRAAADLLGIVVHDHVIVGCGRITSFRRSGLL